MLLLELTVLVLVLSVVAAPLVRLLVLVALAIVHHRCRCESTSNPRFHLSWRPAKEHGYGAQRCVVWACAKKSRET